MITVKLLGGAKRIFGKDQIIIEKHNMGIGELLDALRSISDQNIVSANMLIAVNGIELSVLGPNAQIKDGDVVSIVPVVHGGTVECS
jgi:molybdopterin converting factor small subunit